MKYVSRGCCQEPSAPECSGGINLTSSRRTTLDFYTRHPASSYRCLISRIHEQSFEYLVDAEEPCIRTRNRTVPTYM